MSSVDRRGGGRGGGGRGRDWNDDGVKKMIPLGKIDRPYSAFQITGWGRELEGEEEEEEEEEEWNETAGGLWKIGLCF